MTTWHFYLESGKTLLPRAGGLLDQRAGEMEKLRLLDTAFSIVRELTELAEEDKMQVQNLDKAIRGLGAAGNAAG